MAQEKYRRTEQKVKKAPQKKPISSEERRKKAEKAREQARLAAEQRKREKEARKARRGRIFALAFSLAIGFVAIYWCWVAYSIIGRATVPEDALPLLVFTDGERKEDQSFTAEEVTFGGEVYLPVSMLEKYMPISIFGDYDTRSFLISANGEYATFTLGSCNVLVNGQRVAMKGNAFLKDDVLFIPVDFFTDKMNCFSYTHSSALAANVLTYLPQTEDAFLFRDTPTSPTVDFATVPVFPTVPEGGEEPQPEQNV